MGKQATEQKTTIPGAGSQEMAIRRLLEQFASGGVEQLGDLGALAGGEVGSPTGADQELIAGSIGRARQLAEEQLRVTGATQGAQLREQLAGRGVQGSSSDVAQNLLQSLGTQGAINQSTLQAQQQGGQALMNLPFQRGAMQLQANQALFQRIIGAANPVLSAGLQERIAQPTMTQTQSGMSPEQYAKLGQMAVAVGAAPFTGGASLLAVPGAIPGGQGGAASQSSSLYGGFQQGLRQ